MMSPMRERGAARLAVALTAVSTALLLVAGVLLFFNRHLGLSVLSPHLFVVPGFAVVGLVLALRRPGHAIGWLFVAMGLVAAVAAFAFEYAAYAYATAPGSLPAAAWLAWVAYWTWLLNLPALAALLLLFPDGRLPSPRWRVVPWLLGVSFGGVTVWTMLQPGTIDLVVLTTASPAGVAALGDPAIQALGNAPAILVTVAALVGAVASALAPFVRRRRAGPIERQQLKWLAFVAGGSGLAGATGFLLAGASDTAAVVGGVLLVLAFAGVVVGIPVAVGFAILRYRLYDIDRIITRTLVYGLLTAGITVVYLAIVVGIGTLVGSRSKPNLFLSIVATALIAVAFQPARERSRRLANRLVYGKRATPYEVLSDFSRGMAGASTDDSLLRMARLVVEATGAVQATVWLRLGEVLQPQARWPQAGPLPQPVTLEGRAVEQALAVTETRSRSFPVEHEEELLGVLTVIVSPAEPLTPAGEKLIADLAARTGLGLRFERMKERALFARALASFLPPEVAELVEASPSALSLRDELEATIVFSDIRGFSSLAERLPPREVAEVVGRHLTAMVEVVTSQGGVLDKFAGDAVMAVFGAPRPTQDHARRALGCAVAMQRRQAALNDDADSAGLPAFQIGIGVNTGTVIAGTLGGVGRLDYTVLGDAVNVAQRLQSEAMGGEILASAVTVRQSGTDRAEPVGMKQLKGRQELVEAYRIRWADTSTEQHSGETAYAE
jgi:class 3 adenylate cyclase